MRFIDRYRLQKESMYNSLGIKTNECSLYRPPDTTIESPLDAYVLQQVQMNNRIQSMLDDEKYKDTVDSMAKDVAKAAEKEIDKLLSILNTGR